MAIVFGIVAEYDGDEQDKQRGFRLRKYDAQQFDSDIQYLYSRWLQGLCLTYLLRCGGKNVLGLVGTRQVPTSICLAGLHTQGRNSRNNQIQTVCLPAGESQKGMTAI